MNKNFGIPMCYIATTVTADPRPIFFHLQIAWKKGFLVCIPCIFVQYTHFLWPTMRNATHFILGQCITLHIKNWHELKETPSETDCE